MSADAVNYRAMTADDMTAIALVHRAACLVAYRFMNWDHAVDEIAAWYAGKFADWDHAEVAERDGEVIAYLAAAGGLVDQLFVAPEAQGKSTGRRLLEAHLVRGIRPVTLQVFERNEPARRFYERFGFREVDAWWNEVDGARELLMQLD